MKKKIGLFLSKIAIATSKYGRLTGITGLGTVYSLATAVFPPAKHTGCVHPLNSYWTTTETLSFNLNC